MKATPSLVALDGLSPGRFGDKRSYFVSYTWLLVQRILAFALIAAISPLILALYILVRCGSSGPFIFTQPRRGRNNRIFKLYKIRSMRQGSEEKTALGVKNIDPRVTWIGRIMRSTKLDELPQLWNIVKGDMAFVGPRPVPLALENELRRSIPGFHQRYAVLPGLTNIGQICIADNELGEELIEDWKTRFEGELHYIRNRSPIYDLVLIALTCVYVFKILHHKSVAIFHTSNRNARAETKEKIRKPEAPSKETSQSNAILGVPIHSLDYHKAVDRIIQWGRSREHRYVSVCNVHSVTSSLWNPSLKTALLEADLNTADGMPLVWMQHQTGSPEASRVYGPTLMLETLSKLNEEGLSIALYGGHPERLPKLESFIRRNFPKVTIAESISPPFRSLTLDEQTEFENRLVKAKAAVIWVGIGCPKQEIWMHRHSRSIPGVMVGVGAAFDFHAGAVRQAPAALQRIGLEWLFRLYCEPRRLFGRYATTNPIFVALSLGQLAKRYLTRIPRA